MNKIKSQIRLSFYSFFKKIFYFMLFITLRFFNSYIYLNKYIYSKFFIELLKFNYICFVNNKTKNVNLTL